MGNITTTNRMAILDLIAQADETTEVTSIENRLTDLEDFIQVDATSGYATFSASQSIVSSVTDGTYTTTNYIAADNTYNEIVGEGNTSLTSVSGAQILSSITDGTTGISTILQQNNNINISVADFDGSDSSFIIDANKNAGSVIVDDLTNGVVSLLTLDPSKSASADGTFISSYDASGTSSTIKINPEGIVNLSTDGVSTNTQVITATYLDVTINATSPDGGVSDISYTSGTIPPAGIYSDVPIKSTDGSGINATFYIRFTTFLTTQVTLNGSGFSVGDTITLSGADLGGVDGTDDMVVTVDVIIPETFTSQLGLDPVNSNILQINDDANVAIKSSLEQSKIQTTIQSSDSITTSTLLLDPSEFQEATLLRTTDGTYSSTAYFYPQTLQLSNTDNAFSYLANVEVNYTEGAYRQSQVSIQTGGGTYGVLTSINNYTNIDSEEGFINLSINDVNGNNAFVVKSNTINLMSVPAFDDDTDASSLLAGDIYQTTGLGASPLDVAGILMIKQ